MLFAQQRPLIPSVGHRFGYIHEYPTDYLPLSSLPGWWFQPTPLKNMTSSVGMMTFAIYGKIKIGFQTTNH